ncbi:transposase [Ktedonosporobacter rubrisoli]|uniref:Transposase n=1 Tax=Ktedonosporobacter rubrisoli TaxID=2509675 RepID=A0A4P6K458_KTERU|nr:RNA-guided endonuclease TnpB family protein [Ktedonosporobacter rubrisoli]QBD82713.1 transposase [Ktedonosporobacter rubrisoli]
MKTVITAKLKLQTTPAQFAALRATQLAYRDSLNYVSHYAFAHDKMSNKVKLQEGTYDVLRSRFHLPSQMACSVPRQVGATYKALWSKVKQNATHRKANHTKKRYKGLDQPPKYVSPTLDYQYGKDYSFKKDQHVSVLTLHGRIILAYSGYERHVALLQHGAEIGAAKLWYDKARKTFYLLVPLHINVPDPMAQTLTGIVGVDVGIRYLAVTSDTKGACSFYSGKGIVPKATHYARLRKRLQKKGTRSATRRLVAISGRERRLKQDANHRVSAHIVKTSPHSLLGLEHLTDIRERRRRKRGKKASRKQRKANAASCKWSFAELQSMIAYKALLQGSMAIKVDAHYTSKACPLCGHTADANRPNNGLLFVCQNCHYTLHADLVGARNIMMRTLLARQDWASTGSLSMSPDVSSAEIKAARLSRYAELRWNLDTSSLPSGGSN